MLISPIANPKLIKRPMVESLTTMSRSRIYALMSTGDFPKPVTIGAMSVAWIESEVVSWIEAKIALRNPPKVGA